MKNLAELKSLSVIAENIFCEVLTIPQTLSISASEIQKKFLVKLNEFCNDSSNNNYSAMEIEYAKYALCAWIDEYIYANSSISAEWFSYSLTLREFGDAQAGRIFFERIENLHKIANCERVLELYVKCILFGFQGKFRMDEKAELKQILTLALSKIKIIQGTIIQQPKQKNKNLFSLRKRSKNILITGLCKEKCKQAAQEQTAPKGYKFIYADFETECSVPFLDGIIFINPMIVEIEQIKNENKFAENLWIKQKAKCPIYMVSDWEIAELKISFDRNYKFSSEDLIFYLQENFLNETAAKNILSLPRKLDEWTDYKGEYSMPFFEFMRNEKPLAYSFSKKFMLILSAIVLLSVILFLTFKIINENREKLLKEANYLLHKREQDSIARAMDSLAQLQDSLNMEFEKNLLSLESNYQKKAVANFPFAKNKIPTATEIENYFSESGEFKKFVENLDTITDERIKLKKKTVLQLRQLLRNKWNKISTSITVTTPKTASAKLTIDSSHIEIGQGESKTMKILFPLENSSGVELSVKTAHNNFSEKIKGEWALLELAKRPEISFKDKSYLIDIGIAVHWNLPSDAIMPIDWFGVELEHNLIGEYNGEQLSE
ncbi:hypothetical protein AGMMS49938_10550 [Fibrobacterales bacterium]|nr:hypothetical protein AGMMS49938_10550 [Fibrobacterales bacterium]